MKLEAQNRGHNRLILLSLNAGHGARYILCYTVHDIQYRNREEEDTGLCVQPLADKTALKILLSVFSPFPPYSAGSLVLL